MSDKKSKPKSPKSAGKGTKKTPSFKVGDTAFYPGHGVVQIAALQKQTVGDQEHEMYSLELRRGGKVMLPAARIQELGVRPVISSDEAQALLDEYKSGPSLDPISDWRVRANEHKEWLATGSAKDYARVFFELIDRKKNGKLSMNDTRSLIDAQEYFLSELAHALETSENELQQSLGLETDPI